MAEKKTLKKRTLPLSNKLNQVAGKSQRLQREITEELNVRDMTADEKQHVLELPIDRLVEDPFNVAIYGISEVDTLSESIKKDGFSGVILAYPYDGNYMIESGHRRFEAAKEAGLATVPVYVTEAPREDFEKKLRLFRGNLHGRKYTPMIMARTAAYLYEAHEKELAYKKEHGLLKEGEITALNELVAIDMEISVHSVEKYKQLLKLVPRLRELADSGDISWAPLAAASGLNELHQNVLADRIEAERLRNGDDGVKGSWITTEIRRVKMSYAEAKPIMPVPTETPAFVKRRKDGAKVIAKCTENLLEVLDQPALYKEKDIPAVIGDLERLRQSVDKKISELKRQQ